MGKGIDDTTSIWPSTKCEVLRMKNKIINIIETSLLMLRDNKLLTQQDVVEINVTIKERMKNYKETILPLPKEQKPTSKIMYVNR